MYLGLEHVLGDSPETEDGNGRPWGSDFIQEMTESHKGHLERGLLIRAPAYRRDRRWAESGATRAGEAWSPVRASAGGGGEGAEGLRPWDPSLHTVLALETG